MIEKKTMVIIVLAVIVLFFAGNVIKEKYGEKKQETALTNQQYGYNVAINEIMVELTKCDKPVQLIFGNYSITIFAAECFKFKQG